jgi:hypothetical protein
MISEKRQVTFTEDELKVIGVAPGDEFIVTVEHGAIVLTPLPLAA